MKTANLLPGLFGEFPEALNQPQFREGNAFQPLTMALEPNSQARLTLVRASA